MKKLTRHPWLIGMLPAVMLVVMTCLLAFACFHKWVHGDADHASPKVTVQESRIRLDLQKSCKDRCALRSSDPTAVRRQLEGLKEDLFAARKIKDPFDQNKAFEAILTGLSVETISTLLLSIEPGELDGVVSQRLFERWANAEPERAIEWALSLADFTLSRDLMDLAAMRWANSNLAEAVEWVRKLPEGESRTSILAALSREAVRLDPWVALCLARELPEGSVSKNLCIRASGEWANQDHDRALEWARQIQNIRLRQEVLEQIAIVIAGNDLQVAANIARHDMAPGRQQDRALVAIVQRWAQKDPAVAASWVSQFPEDSLGQDAAETLVSLWAQSDSKATGEWLFSLPPSAMKERAIFAYSRFLRQADGLAADRWEASAIETP